MRQKDAVWNEECAKLVERHASVGTATADIAKLIGLSERNLKYVYAQELELGKTRADFRLKETAYHMAVDDKNTAMAIFLLKARCGYRETSNVEVKNTSKLVLFSDEPVPELPEDKPELPAKAEEEQKPQE